MALSSVRCAEKIPPCLSVSVIAAYHHLTACRSHALVISLMRCPLWSMPKIIVSGNFHGLLSFSTVVRNRSTLFQYSRSSRFGHVTMCSMLSSWHLQCSLYVWLLFGCLLRASVALCSKRLQFFSSVGSDSGVPSDRHTSLHIWSVSGCARCAFQFSSQFGRTPSVMRLVKYCVISCIVSSLSFLSSTPPGFLAHHLYTIRR